MKNIIKNFVLLAIAIPSLLLFTDTVAIAQTPPAKVTQADGTIQLVPVPPAVVYTPYYIDPTMTYRVVLESQWANVDWNGAKRNGLIAKKGDVVEARILAQPISKIKIVDGKTVYLWSIFRSADFIIAWDSAKFELLSPTVGGFGYDTSVMNPSKSSFVTPELSGGVNEIAIPQDGTALFHAEALPLPENRVPALKPSYYQWNFDGYMWQSGYRLLGTLRFKVKGDFYYPTSQLTDIKILPSLTINGVETKTRVDGSPIIGTNILSETRNATNQIKFGVGSEYKVSQTLSVPNFQFKAGDTVPVRLSVKNESLPQKIASVCTLFGWDNTKLEFMGISTTGSRASQSNSIYWVGANSINESTVPKDGNAAHLWLTKLGDKTFIDAENLIVTLNFKVVSDFTTTEIKILQKNDPALSGLQILDDCGILGSDVPGSFVTGVQTNAVIRGVLTN